MNKITTWHGYAIESMSLNQLREARSQIVDECRRVDRIGPLAADPLSRYLGETIGYRHRLRLALSLCIRLESQHVRERAEGMCM